MIKKAFGYITHPFKRLSFKIKYKCRFNSAHKKISRKQNRKNPEVSLVITGGGLGDFFVNLPMIQSIVDSNRKVVVLTPFMSGYPYKYNELNHDFDLVVINIEKWSCLFDNKKTMNEMSKELGKYCVKEVFNLGPVSFPEIEEAIRGFKYAKKYSFVSRYTRIGNYPVPLEEFNKIKERYDLFYQGEFEKTNYQIQKEFLKALDIKFVDKNHKYNYVNFESNLVPKEDYFVIFLNGMNDPRDASLNIFVGVANHIYNKYKYKLVLMGGKDDLRTVMFMRHIPKEDVINIRGKTSLGDYIEVIKHARIVISSDTSASHLANAYETKSVVFCTDMFDNALFPYEWGFGEKGQLIIQNKMECNHCYYRYNNKQFRPECEKRYVCADSYDLNDSIKKIEGFFKGEI